MNKTSLLDEKAWDITLFRNSQQCKQLCMGRVMCNKPLMFTGVNVRGFIPRLPWAALFPCTDTLLGPFLVKLLFCTSQDWKQNHLCLNVNHILKAIMLRWDIWTFKTLICIHNRWIINIGVYRVSLRAQVPKRTLQIISCRNYCGRNTKHLVRGSLKIPF